MTLGDSTYCKIRTEQTFKGRPEDPIVEGTTFGWIIHGGEEYADFKCMFIKEAGEYEKLYSLDVLEVEDRGEDDQPDVHNSFKESITRGEDGRYEVSVPWIPSSSLSSTNEQPSRRRLIRVEKKLSQDPKLREEYEKIVREQLEKGIVEVAPETPTGDRTFYMPHKPVVRESASTTKIKNGFQCKCKTTPSGQQHKRMYVHGSIIAALTVGHLDQSTHVHPPCSSGYSKGVFADWPQRGG